ncbi:MAG: Fe-S cluster assembly sulfur transfer protein SufU [archaeon]
MAASSETTSRDFAGEGLYREFILDHYQHPQNHGTLSHASVSHREKNISCGDDVSFQLKIDKTGKIMEAKFTGSLCVISTASASLLSEEIKGKTLQQISKMSRNEVLSLLGLELGPTRLKCAMLPLDTIQNAVHIYQNYPRSHHA